MRRDICRRGVTLLEMMLVVGLVVVFIGITATYNKEIARQIVIERAHATAFSLFIKARSAGLTVPKSYPGELICGYGVNIVASTRTFTYFKDLSTSLTDCSAADRRYTNADEKLDQKILGDMVTVTSNISDIVYVPPFGKTYIDGIESQTSASIVITSPTTDISKGIRANAFGQVTEFKSQAP